VTLHDWKNLDVTQVILGEFKIRQQSLKDQLATSAGLDPLADRWKAGAIAAYEDVLNIDMDGEAQE
jgi:hypothetical protein